MQAAYWVGRQSAATMGGVTAHLYAEFDHRGAERKLDVKVLRRAVQLLGERHAMLRLRVSADGLQAVDGDGPVLEVDDFQALDEEALGQALATKREVKTNQRLPIHLGRVSDFSLSLLPGNRCRLHVDTDMIAIDPQSFRRLMEDLARLYEDGETREPAAACYFDYLALMEADDVLAVRRERDRDWWRARLSQMPHAPALPRPEEPQAGVRSHRLAAQLGPLERQALTETARRHHLTLSTLMLGLFAAVLGASTASRRFRLNVPMFHREPYMPGVDEMIGEFSNPLILPVELAAGESVEGLCQRIGTEMTLAISHAAYPGPSVMRDLSRLNGEMQLAPVVFTAGLDLGGELFSERVTRVFGAMGFVISQGPQVALDAQVASAYGGILVNWDVRLDAIPEAWVKAMFEAYLACARHVAGAPEALSQPVEALLAVCLKSQPSATSHTGRSAGLEEPRLMAPVSAPERALTPLQRAYLLGRGDQFPLGGVAMQEFREYRGALAIDQFKARLHALVSALPCLRNRIDTDSLTQRVSEEARLNLEEIDLRDLPSAKAWERIEAMREDYAHHRHDLSLPPWHMLVFHLPEPQPGQTHPDSHVVFARFDALVVDGRSIATILRQLFGSVPLSTAAPLSSAESRRQPEAAEREADAAYWAHKLEAVSEPPRLPWKRPLADIKASRYERRSMTVPRDDFVKLTKVGAARSLFRHSVLTAVILETLAHWAGEGGFCVGVPVALPTGAMGNDSTFIAIDYRAGEGTFDDRAKQLQADTLEGLEHLAFSDIDINRLLINRHSGGPVLPVVVTNGLSWETLAEHSPVRLHGGLTQTPQVAMDIRMSLDEHKNLVLCIDHAREALDGEVVEAILAAMARAIAAVGRHGELVLPAGEVLDLGHYRHNDGPTSLAPAGFLARIAAHLFGGATAKDALICGERRISYAELGDQVARIAAALRQRGLRRGEVVAVCLPRSPEHVMVTLACSLMGLVWVPIDAGSPPDRIGYLLRNCRAALVVGPSPAPGIDTVSVETLLLAEASGDWQPAPEFLTDLSASEDAAYYLYTSGTTGKPKCVVVANRATWNVIDHTLQFWGIGAEDVFISVTPLHHDMSVFDIYGALCAGASLVMPAVGEEKDAIGWNRLVERHKVSVWCSVPAILEMLLACQRGEQLKSLRLIAQGGDYIKPTVIDQLRRTHPATRLISLGGPTETTIWSIWHEIGPDDIAVIPYGRPLPGVSYFVLDERGQHCPPHVVGRIHTAGVAAALGYLEDGRLSQNDFVSIAAEDGRQVRAFRTGDRGFYRPDGTLIFAGRINGYVKIRGVRVSLPDIENELAAHDSIKHVMVVDYPVGDAGELALAAIYVSEARSGPSVGELRSFARRRLPETHVPIRFLRIETLPLSANGKPDRKRARQILLGSDASEGGGSGAIRPVPASPSSSGRILDIYLSVLGKARQDGHDEGADFVSMGLLPSHLKAVAGRISGEFGVSLTPAHLLRCRNARQVEELLAR
ncbi:peptide synthetase [Labrys sp. WJW]|uniref:amino acid adenylation domain-containing protein n=1 Tax=Labrys sp. WJW TaxID=1737983 RepID=UPI000836E5D9|nr:amino acid adenylation domain-containing protein [Labrys sp. WJW]OCC01331.1 peptide synthetase [Labrys sp. WJW]